MDYQNKDASANKGLDGAKKEEAKVAWQRPTQSNVITSPFGPRNVKGGSKNHKGIDLRARQGESYYAAADGKVTKAGGDGYNTIVIDHGNGIQTRYLHASSVAAKIGDVKAGARLAASGGMGPKKGVNQYAYHLHFEVIKDGTKIDPEAFLKSKGIDVSRKGQKGNNDKASMLADSSKATEEVDNGTSDKAAKNDRGVSNKKELQMNAEGHPIYYPKGVQDTIERINWNKARNYTTTYIKAFQKLIETEADGGIGTNTVNAIRHYQEKNNLLSKDGKWGKECAEHSGLERKYKSTSSSSNTKSSSSGGSSAGSFSGSKFGGAKRLRELMVDGKYPFKNVPAFKGIKAYTVSSWSGTLNIQPEQLEEKDDPNQKGAKQTSKAPKGDSYSSKNKESRGYKFNNPCDISHSGTDIGYISSQKVADGQPLAKFDSMVNGIASTMRLLKKKYNDKSVRDMNTVGGYQGYYKANEEVGLTALRLIWITNTARDLGVGTTDKMNLDDKGSMFNMVNAIAERETRTTMQQGFLEKAYNIAFPGK